MEINSHKREGPEEPSDHVHKRAKCERRRHRRWTCEWRRDRAAVSPQDAVDEAREDWSDCSQGSECRRDEGSTCSEQEFSVDEEELELGEEVKAPLACAGCGQPGATRVLRPKRPQPALHCLRLCETCGREEHRFLVRRNGLCVLTHEGELLGACAELQQRTAARRARRRQELLAEGRTEVGTTRDPAPVLQHDLDASNQHVLTRIALYASDVTLGAALNHLCVSRNFHGLGALCALARRRLQWVSVSPCVALRLVAAGATRLLLLLLASGALAPSARAQLFHRVAFEHLHCTEQQAEQPTEPGAGDTDSSPEPTARRHLRRMLRQLLALAQPSDLRETLRFVVRKGDLGLLSMLQAGQRQQLGETVGLMLRLRRRQMLCRLPWLCSQPEALLQAATAHLEQSSQEACDAWRRDATAVARAVRCRERQQLLDLFVCDVETHEPALRELLVQILRHENRDMFVWFMERCPSACWSERCTTLRMSAVPLPHWALHELVGHGLLASARAGEVANVQWLLPFGGFLGALWPPLLFEALRGALRFRHAEVVALLCVHLPPGLWTALWPQQSQGQSTDQAPNLSLREPSSSDDSMRTQPAPREVSQQAPEGQESRAEEARQESEECVAETDVDEGDEGDQSDQSDQSAVGHSDSDPQVPRQHAPPACRASPEPQLSPPEPEEASQQLRAQVRLQQLVASVAQSEDRLARCEARARAAALCTAKNRPLLGERLVHKMQGLLQDNVRHPCFLATLWNCCDSVLGLLSLQQELRLAPCDPEALALVALLRCNACLVEQLAKQCEDLFQDEVLESSALDLAVMLEDPGTVDELCARGVPLVRCSFLWCPRWARACMADAVNRAVCLESRWLPCRPRRLIMAFAAHDAEDRDGSLASTLDVC